MFDVTSESQYYSPEVNTENFARFPDGPFLYKSKQQQQIIVVVVVVVWVPNICQANENASHLFSLHPHFSVNTRCGY